MKRFPVGVAAAVSIVSAMTLVADLCGRHEIFFPEILALAMGCFVMARRPWNVTPARLFLTMTIGAWLGWGLLQVEPIPLAARMVLGFFLCGGWLHLAGTNMVPMLSACLLPLMLGRAGLLYPISISVLTLLLLLVERRLLLRGVGEDRPYEKPSRDWRRFLVRWSLLTLLLAVLLIPAVLAGGFWAVPPLVVGFTAFADQKRPARRQFLRGVAVFAIAALLGAAGAWTASTWPVVPRWAVTGALSCVFLCLCRGMGYFLPPSGAVLLLAFLMPRERLWLYACQVPAGALVFLAAGRLFSRAEERISGHRG